MVSAPCMVLLLTECCERACFMPALGMHAGLALDARGFHPLHYAAIKGDIDELRAILAAVPVPPQVPGQPARSASYNEAQGPRTSAISLPRLSDYQLDDLGGIKRESQISGSSLPRLSADMDFSAQLEDAGQQQQGGTDPMQTMQYQALADEIIIADLTPADISSAGAGNETTAPNWPFGNPAAAQGGNVQYSNVQQFNLPSGHATDQPQYNDAFPGGLFGEGAPAGGDAHMAEVNPAYQNDDPMLKAELDPLTTSYIDLPSLDGTGAAASLDHEVPKSPELALDHELATVPNPTARPIVHYAATNPVYQAGQVPLGGATALSTGMNGILHPSTSRPTYSTGLLFPNQTGQAANAPHGVNVRDTQGHTAVAWSVRAEQKTSLQYLIQNRADVTLAASSGTTPLHFACLLSSDVTFVEELLRAQAAVNAPDRDGNTCLMLAVRDGALLTIEALLRSGADVSLKNHQGMTALIQATLQCRLDVVARLLQDNGAAAMAQDSSGRTALHWACALGSAPCADLLVTINIDTVFLESNNGDTPCHAAILGDHVEVVDMLLKILSTKQQKKLLNTPNAAGFTPIELAQDVLANNMVKFLAPKMEPYMAASPMSGESSADESAAGSQSGHKRSGDGEAKRSGPVSPEAAKTQRRDYMYVRRSCLACATVPGLVMDAVCLCYLMDDPSQKKQRVA